MSRKNTKHQLHMPSAVTKSGSARLHLIIQFPVLNTSGNSDHDILMTRQKEYIYCLQRNLLTPHVSSFTCVLRAVSPCPYV